MKRAYVMNLKKMLDNIKKFKKFRELKKNISEDGLIYTPLEFAEYGFAMFSQEKYESELEKLKECQFKHRYYYYENLSNENNKTNSKEIIFIMFNPSSACPHKDDPTIKNCRILAKNNQYISMEIINIFSERNPNIKNLKGDNNSLNIRFIAELLKSRTKSDIVLAWGNKKIPEEIRSCILNLQSKNKNILIITYSKPKVKIQIRHPGNQGWSRLGGFNTAKLTNIKDVEITLEKLLKIR